VTYGAHNEPSGKIRKLIPANIERYTHGTVKGLKKPSIRPPLHLGFLGKDQHKKEQKHTKY
jgi:hypothetical protein